MFRFPSVFLAALSAITLPPDLVHGPDVSVLSVLRVDVAVALDAVDAGRSTLSKSKRFKNTTRSNVFEQIATSQSNQPNDRSGGKKSKNAASFADQAAREESGGQQRHHVAQIEAQRAKASFRYVEDVAPGLKLDMDLHSILHMSTSPVQSVQVIDSYFGRTLVTDGKTQSAEHDEFVYHESLVHPALFWSAYLSDRSRGTSAGAPKSVFIGGGGELATAREVLRHNTVERIVMVDIDPEVIEVSRKHLPEWGGDAVANHPKVEYIVGDVLQYLSGSNEKFDAMIIDVSDPIEAGPAVALYTQEFYRLVSLRLNEHGVFVTQAGSASFIPFPHSSIEGEGEEATCFGPIKNTLATVFDHAIPYSAPVASFGEDWGFVLAFNGPREDARTLVDLSHEEIDDLIEDRIETVPGVPAHKFRSIGVKSALRGDETGGEVLKHYDGVVHRRLFSLSKPLREAMKSDHRIMTEANPIFMY
mmetsp:Transcript_2438/g.5235  ORF Transcript_2438/g.5235 Transcript_2438/m.5235 type:complete len:474 (-) Transcript_2438:169-1590(-)|eukprot:CAMPEP_0172530686 /NCGR_PEP_ID=MMETSP1067-20121228/4340_1 /TAXON_ID=265564 ORGANISM="Thalassiosira punctigera, Strain Tpunct2005C2" /NCGR_SAMPLE_ID=MMETSP1067 /ASSEMBLY_ACC=CAM_ASM_000444 /LENGTH=473 /DNA_ID=CAMNT_0013314931 /DNA_START=111 /DNA_END=1532 /DNA_ORIENTATION=-